MNLKEYQQKRDAEKKALERSIAKSRVKCFQCFRSVKACFCSRIQSFQTNTEFCLLMHPMEAKKERVGTGRLSNIALNNCSIIIDENFDENKKVQELIESSDYFPMLLYPGDKAHNISKDPFPSSQFEGKKLLLFIIDGTWPCAKSMMRDSKILHSLPRLTFESDLESLFKIKHQPAKYCLSTIESIYQVLIALEKQGFEALGGRAEHLLEILKWVVDYQIECAHDPDRAKYRSHQKKFKDSSERQISKKWNGRSICFEEKNFN